MTTAVRDRLPHGGAAIHIGSIAADKGAGSYGAAKAGLASWNIALAAELGPRGITTNVVSPGYVAHTELLRDQRRDALIAATSTGRAATPDDIAGTVCFLASDAARQITGQVIAGQRRRAPDAVALRAPVVGAVKRAATVSQTRMAVERSVSSTAPGAPPRGDRHRIAGTREASSRITQGHAMASDTSSGPPLEDRTVITSAAIAVEEARRWDTKGRWR
ncbi:MAG: SDR family oxidoreductase [Mycobacteriales bacterium]